MVGERFSQRILKEKDSLVIFNFNGGKINSKTNTFEYIQKLEDFLVENFSEILFRKLECRPILASRNFVPN